MNSTTDASPKPEPPVLDIDPYSLDVLDNPYPFFEALRETAPVVLIKPYGVYAVGRYEEARIVLTDHLRFTASCGIGLQDIRRPGQFHMPNLLLENDPPGHTGIRTILSKILSPMVVRKWRDAFTARDADLLVKTLLETRQFDGMELVEAYVLKVFPEAVGLQLPRDTARAIGEMSFNQTGPPNELYRAAMKAAEPYLDWFDRSALRENIAAGSIGEMLYDAEARGELGDGTASNICRVFVIGGTDTTIAGIGLTLNQLARNGKQWSLLRANPDLARNAFDEGIRYESPSYVNYRTTTESTGSRCQRTGIYNTMVAL